MNDLKKKVVACILAVVMVVSLVPMMAFATEENSQTPPETDAAQETENKDESTDKTGTDDTAVEPEKQEEEKPEQEEETTKETKKKVVNKKKVKIMLDAGHAGKYNRGYYRKYWESQMNWKLTNYLKNELKKYGFIVGMTKKSLRHDMSVYRRGKKARGYDLFISIHSNWSRSKRADYPLAIVSSKHKKKLYKKAQPIGKKLAKQIRVTMKTRQKARVWVKRQRNGKDWYGVIRGAAAVNVPAVILEHSFHSNPRKCKWLMKNSNLERMAVAEAKILAKHYGMKKIK